MSPLLALALLATAEPSMEITGLDSWLACYKALWEGNLVPDARTRMLADGTVLVLSGETFHVYGPERRAWRVEVPGITDGKEHRTAKSTEPELAAIGREVTPLFEAAEREPE